MFSCLLYITILHSLVAFLYLTVLYSPGALLATNSTGTAEPAGTWTSALLARYREVHVGAWHYHVLHYTLLQYGVFQYSVFQLNVLYFSVLCYSGFHQCCLHYSLLNLKC